jgi:hypothetical protein
MSSKASEKERPSDPAEPSSAGRDGSHSAGDKASPGAKADYNASGSKASSAPSTTTRPGRDSPATIAEAKPPQESRQRAPSPRITGRQYVGLACPPFNMKMYVSRGSGSRYQKEGH